MSNSSDRLEHDSAGIIWFARVAGWLEEVDQSFRQRGLYLPSENRIAHARKVICGLAANGGARGQMRHQEVLAALLDSIQWRLIFRVAARRPIDPEFDKKIKRALKAPVATDPFGPDPWRDLQFELFTWASLKDVTAPKLRSSFVAGADILLSDDAGEMAIECKRITSQAKFVTRFADARNQVEEVATLGGFATDLTGFIDHESPPSAATKGEAGEALVRNLRDVMLERRHDLGGPGALKVWSAYVCRFFEVADALVGPIHCWVHVPIGDGTEQEELRMMEKFAHPASYSFSETE